MSLQPRFWIFRIPSILQRKFPWNISGFSKARAETCRAAGTEGRQQSYFHSVHNSTKCQSMLVESFSVLVLLADSVSIFSGSCRYQPVHGPFKTAEKKSTLCIFMPSCSEHFLLAPVNLFAKFQLTLVVFQLLDKLPRIFLWQVQT